MSLFDVYGGQKIQYNDPALSNMVCDAANTTVSIFSRIGKGGEVCDEFEDSEKNPFGLQDFKVSLVHAARGFFTTCVSPKQSREEFGALENQVYPVSIIRPEIEIETGFWCYLVINQREIVGGMIDRIDRVTAGAWVKIYVNSSKPVPFKPTFVGLPDWLRQPQN